MLNPTPGRHPRAPLPRDGGGCPGTGTPNPPPATTHLPRLPPLHGSEPPAESRGTPRGASRVTGPPTGLTSSLKPMCIPQSSMTFLPAMETRMQLRPTSWPAPAGVTGKVLPTPSPSLQSPGWARTAWTGEAGVAAFRADGRGKWTVRAVQRAHEYSAGGGAAPVALQRPAGAHGGRGGPGGARRRPGAPKHARGERGRRRPRPRLTVRKTDASPRPPPRSLHRARAGTGRGPRPP